MFDARLTTALRRGIGRRAQRRVHRTTSRPGAWPALIVGFLAVTGCHKVREPAGTSVPPTQGTPPPAAPSPSVPTPSGDTGPGPVKVACPDDARSAVKVIDDRHCEVARAVFFGEGPGCVSAMPRLAPQSERGQVIGFRYDGVGRNSVYALCGIRSGDIWTRVNAVSLSSPEEVLRSYEALRGAPDLTISLLREGQPFQVNVGFR
jgi:hypothetical protein